MVEEMDRRVGSNVKREVYSLLALDEATKSESERMKSSEACS